MSPATDQIIKEAPAATEVITEKIGPYLVHPAARLLPEPSPEDRARLRADIEKHGLLVPIVLTPTGEILDGRTRARICEELGIKWGPNDLNEFYNKMTVTLDSEEAGDPVVYVLSVNAARRHLSGDQVIAVYLEANKAKLEADKLAAKATQRANLKKGAAQPEKSSMNLSGEILSGETAASKIAKAVGKSESAVKRVQRAKKAAPERFAEVVEGKISASEILKEITSTGPDIKVLKRSKGTKSDEHGSVRTNSIGRRIPRLPLSDRMERVSWAMTAGIECLGGILIDARKQGYRDFPKLIQKATTWRSMLGAILDLVQQEPCPTKSDLEAILNPDDDSVGNEAEP
jgi:hypothetical protein